MKIYVASSWRNEHQPAVVKALRADGHEVYDFRGPETWFDWAQVDPNWKEWSVHEYLHALLDPVSVGGFDRDMTALRDCDACVVVMPCGHSAGLEAGWAKGAGKILIGYIPEFREAELMIKMADYIVTSLDMVRGLLREYAELKVRTASAEVKDEMVTIQIDRLPFTVAGGVLTGHQILSLAPPRPIGNLELWLVGCGSNDEKVEAAALVDVREGMRFFTAPAFINNSQHTCLNCGTVWERIHRCPAVVKEKPAAPAEVVA